MKRYLALLLFAIMVVSVISIAGVVTTKKAEAAPSGIYNLPVNRPSHFDGSSVNFYSTSFSRYPATGVGTAEHFTKSERNFAQIKIRSDKENNKRDGLADAKIGVQYRLTCFSDWNAVKDRKVTIKFTYYRDVAAARSSALPAARWTWVRARMIVSSNNFVPAGSTDITLQGPVRGDKTVTFTRTVEQLTSNPGASIYTGLLNLDMVSGVGLPAVNAVPANALGVQQAYGGAQIRSIDITPQVG